MKEEVGGVLGAPTLCSLGYTRLMGKTDLN